MGLVSLENRFRDIGHVEDLLVGQKVQIFQCSGVFCRQGEVPAGDPPSQGVLDCSEKFQSRRRLPVAGLCPLLQDRQPSLQSLQIGKHQFGIDDFHIAGGIHDAVHMDHIGIVEAADDVDDGIYLPNMAEKFVPQPFAAARTFYQTGDIEELHGRIGLAGGIDDPGDVFQPRVRNGDDADIGIDGAEGVIGHFRPGGGKGIEDSRFAYIGKADDPAAETHDLTSRME